MRSGDREYTALHDSRGRISRLSPKAMPDETYAQHLTILQSNGAYSSLQHPNEASGSRGARPYSYVMSAMDTAPRNPVS